MQNEKQTEKDRQFLRGKKIGLVLSGGGAKGAYQIGMLRALEEFGLEKENLTIAGTSIGALNALMYAIGDLDSVRDMVWRMKDMIDDTDRNARELFPDEKLLANRIPVTVCAYCLEDERPEYFRLNGLTPQEQRDMTVASASLPDLLPPIVHNGKSYLDGGKIPPQCSPEAAPADKIPLDALAAEHKKNNRNAAAVAANAGAGSLAVGAGAETIEAGSKFDFVIISYLKPEDEVDWTAVEAPVMELWPSEPLEDEPGTGTRDYSPERLTKNEQMGYEETKELLEIYAETDVFL